MAAVIAAIAAGFLAGAVALFREHRIQERQLLVAARVMDEVLQKAERGVAVSLTSNGWAPFNLMPTQVSFETSWEAYRGDLAGHLAWSEWQKLAAAVALHGAIRSMTQDEPPKESEETLDELGKVLNVARRQLGPYRVGRFSVWRSLQRKGGIGDWSARRPS